MERETYRITQSTKFIIYGAATTGAIFYNNLISQGYDVVSFVDRRADEIHRYLDIPAVTLKDIGKTGVNPDDANYCIIIAIKNVFEHEDVASIFVEKGYYNLLFKTVSLVKGNADTADMLLGETYDLLFKNKTVEDRVLYKTQKINYFPFLDSNILDDDTKVQVKVKIPRTFIFSDKKENSINAWNFVSIMGLIPHLDFFDCIKGDVDKNLDSYMKYCYEAAERSGGILTSDRWKKSVIENRIDVYYNMELENQLNPKFFDNSAPEAVLEDTGVFSLHSGKHRMIYQVINGKYFITLTLNRSEYLRWRRKDVALNIYNKLKRWNVRKLSVPIMNPYFYRFPCDNMMYYYDMQFAVVEFIYRYYFVGKHITDFREHKVYNSGIQGMVLCPVLAKMGFQVYSDSYRDVRLDEMKQMLCELYSVKVDETRREEGNYNVVCADSLEAAQKFRNAELMFYIDDFKEEKLTMVSYKECIVLGSGFCDNIRKKYTVYIRG